MNPTRGAVTRWIAGVVVGIALAYAMVVGALYLSQRSLVYPAPNAASQVPAGFRQVTLRTADGLSLAAAWQPPSAGHRAALFFHGNGDDWAGSARAMAAFTQAGYGVLVPEYRGYGSNPGKPDEAGLYADGRAAMAWLRAAGFAPDQVVVVGNSIGSGPATRIATETTPAALILVSAFANLPEVAADQFPWLPARWLIADRYDNETAIAAVTAPVLILHGGADQLIDSDHALRLSRAAPRDTLRIVPGAGHELAWLRQAGELEMKWLRSRTSATPLPE